MRTLQRRFALIRRCALGLSLVVPLLFAQGDLSQAALIYDEAIDGDLSFTSTVVPLMFSAGINVVSGDSRFFLNPLSLDIDPFSFSIPASHELADVALSFDNFVSLFSSNETTSYQILGETAFQDVLVASASPPIALFLADLPLPGPSINWLHGLGFTSSIPSVQTGFSFDYTISFTVTPIPLPAALPLFGSALAMLGIVGWRRRRQAGA